MDSVSREILDAWQSVLASKRYVLGPQLESFEAELASFLGVNHVVGVGSGSDALTLSLRALDIGPGDEVVLPTFTFIATAEAVVHTGATPVFCDIDPDTWTMIPETVEPVLTDRTKALIPVDIFGNPAPYADLAKLDIPMVEDACQAIGSTYQGKQCGSFGEAAAISFYPSKNLPGFGDGGAVATDSQEIADRIKRLRHHGNDGGSHIEVGYTSRLDELQAAGLRVLLRNIEPQLERRRIAGRKMAWNFAYRAQQATPESEPAWHLMAWKLPGRDAKLKSSSSARIYYDPPVHLQPSMAPWYRGPLPTAEALSKLVVARAL